MAEVGPDQLFVSAGDEGKGNPIVFWILEQKLPGLVGQDSGGEGDVAGGAVFQVAGLVEFEFGGDGIDGADRCWRLGSGRLCHLREQSTERQA